MSDSIRGILSFPAHTVSSLDVIASSCDTVKRNDYSIFPDKLHYIRRYLRGCREVGVYVHNLGDGETSVELVEKEEALLPKRGARLVAFSVMYNGKNFASINWKDLMVFTRERRAMVYVQSAEDADDFIDVALEAAKLLRQQYKTVYRERMMYAPLEGMILTEIVR